MAAAPFTPEQLTLRRPVWEALSELYLDTDTRPDLPALARTLAASGLDVPELETIWHGEVTPLLHGNLLSVAGVWAGFDQAWLEAQIILRRTRPDRRWPPLARLVRSWQNELDPYFRTTLILRGELLALPEAQWPDRVAAWSWLARAYFWPESPRLVAVPATPDLEALFAALEPLLHPLLTGNEPAEHHRLHVLESIREQP